MRRCASCSKSGVEAGLSEEDAFTASDSLVFANLRGIDSHGVVRLPAYVKRLEAGGAKAKPSITVLRDRPALALVDGDNGLGQVIGSYAAKLAVEKARNTGSGFIAVKGSAHYGAASYYSVQIAKQNMIGFSTTGTTQSVAAWGGAQKVLGNDPLSIAVPYQEGKPLVLDISMSKVAGGKLKLAAKNNQKIPSGWGIDKQGRNTEDPNAILDGGAHLPFGDHKGYGLAVMMEILTGVLTGANMLSQIQSWTKYPENPSNIGHCFGALDITCFMDLSEFQTRLNTLVRGIKSSPLMEGVQAIYMPGEIELKTEEERRTQGIPISPKVWSELTAVSQTYGEEINALKS